MSTERRSVWILGDQLLRRHPALLAAVEGFPRQQLRVVLVQSTRRTQRLPYQRKKLVLLFGAMRHYAAELRELGYVVEEISAASFAEGLAQHVALWQPDRLFTMAASEHPTAHLQEEMAGVLGIPVEVLPNRQFLVSHFDPYPDADPDQNVVLEYFYRRMRRHFDVLMAAGGEPAGGQWNFDRQNRKSLPEDVKPPPVPHFEPDLTTRSVMAEVAEVGAGVGTVDDFNLAVTRQQAHAALDDFLERRLPDFGPYEDAMSSQHATLFHSQLSPYLNIGLLEPMELIRAVEDAYAQGHATINSVEGFVRQVLGWREFIYWQYWRLMPGLMEANAWKAERPLPEFFWHGETGMNCLSHALRRALDTGYNHHIERLMLLCNYGLLAGIRPRAVHDWFLSCYVDAYEWVMAPNVMGMGLNADGGVVGTKPYIASANYINRMSDYCTGCRFNHGLRTGPQACPFNFLYWNFLLEHEATLRANPRMGPNVLGLRHLDGEERRAVCRQARDYLDGL